MGWLSAGSTIGAGLLSLAVIGTELFSGDARAGRTVQTMPETAYNPPADAPDRFAADLSEAYLAWAGHLQDAGLWPAAEHLTRKAVACRMGNTPSPEPVLAEPPVPGLGTAYARLTEALQTRVTGDALIAAQPYAEAQAAFDCWAVVQLEEGKSAFQACSIATLTALDRLDGGVGAL